MVPDFPGVTLCQFTSVYVCIICGLISEYESTGETVCEREMHRLALPSLVVWTLVSVSSCFLGAKDGSNNKTSRMVGTWSIGLRDLVLWGRGTPG